MIQRAVLAVAIAAGFLAAANVRAQAYRIMSVGDSITAGYTDNPTWNVPFGFGYRSGLFTRLTQSGLPFTFVGTSPEPFENKFGMPKSVASPDLRTTNNTFDANQDHHEGYGGQGTAFVKDHIASWLTIDKPDVVLLMIGINDIALGSATAPESAKTNLNDIVQTITTERPNTTVVVAQIMPYSTYTPAIVDYNKYIRDTLVPAFAAQKKHVTTVDQYSNFGSGETVDGSLYSNGINHPSAAGYEKMAETWFAGIKALNLPAVPPVVPDAAKGEQAINRGR
jgi:lysophospholipase L1-like esterase